MHAVEFPEVRRDAVCGQQGFAGPQPGFTEVVQRTLGLRAGGISASENLEQVAVLLAARRVGVDPLLHAGLLGAADRRHVETLQAARLPLCIVGVVAQREEIVRIGHPHAGIAFHVAADDVHALLAVADDNRVLDALLLLDGERRGVAVRAPRESDDHLEVAVMHAARGDRQHPARLERHVPGRIVRRAALGIGIDAVEGEIALVLGPAPVVIVASEGADRHGRGPDEPHVPVDVVIVHQIALAAPHGHARNLAVGLCGVLLLDLRIDAAHRHHAPAAFGFEPVLDRLDLRGHILDLAQEPHRLSRNGNLLLARAGPESRFEVVVLLGREGADVAVGHVVVGDHQPLVGDHAPRPHAAVHGNHRIGQGRALFVVDRPGLEFQPFGPHLRVDGPQIVDKPHPLVGCRLLQSQKKRAGACKPFFHRLSFYSFPASLRDSRAGVGDAPFFCRSPPRICIREGLHRLFAPCGAPHLPAGGVRRPPDRSTPRPCVLRRRTSAADPTP